MGAQLIGLGLATLDHLMLLDSFSRPAGKMRVESFDIQGGGLIGSALVAASRLGVETEVWATIGTGPIGDRIVAGLSQEGVCTDRLRRVDEGDGPLILVFVDGETGERRFHSGGWPRPAEPYPLDAAALDGARCLLVDGSCPVEAPEAARLARERGVPVVADLSSVDGPARAIAEAVDYLVVDENCARRVAEDGDPQKVCRRLLDLGPGVVVLTLGAKGCCYASDSSMTHVSAYEVDVVDTTGAGDCFHGAFCVGVIRGWELPRIVEFASAAASINCRTLGGRSGLPSAEQVEKFIEERR